MEVTQKGIRVSRDDGYHNLTVPIEKILSIKPIYTRQICVRYNEGVEAPHPNDHEEVTYIHNESGLTQLQVCNKIYDEFIRLGAIRRNDKGSLFIKSNEHVIAIFPNINAGGKYGQLYITDLRIAHETKNGVSGEMYYKQMISIRKPKEKKLIIDWGPHSAALIGFTFSYNLNLENNTERDSLYTIIKEQLTDRDPLLKSKFTKLDSYYASIDSDAIYDLAKNGDVDLYDYLLTHSRFTFGPICPEFSRAEKELMLACKLHKWDINMISILTQKEVFARNFARKYQQILNVMSKISKHEEKIRESKRSGLRRSSRKIEQDPEYRRLKREETLINNGIIPIVPEHCTNRIRASAMIYYDKRVMMLYKEWCKDNKTKKFENEYDDKWILYLLKELDTPRRREPLDMRCVCINDLQNSLTLRNKNRETLANFSAPDNIDERYIHNNCWYDGKKGIWFVQDDNLHNSMQKVADFNPEQSKAMTGTSAWGFKNENIKMFCGFPSIVIKTNSRDMPIVLSSSRKSGQLVRRWIYADTHYLLPILREDDINVQMEVEYGKLHYRSDTIQYVISPAGYVTRMTPKMAQLANDRYEHSDISISERVRRAIFSVDTGLFFNPQDTALSREGFFKEQHNTLYDERFERRTSDTH